ncbi:hypothetical protein [Geodermatophilus obscurus]|uniref:hypothetical protein n=1 Tax=Geodermatophilus obscurus TaxID=1861 RepID=UPI001140E6B2|nr:hypothetical protein [Geodermatophilus obscurus]
MEDHAGAAGQLPGEPGDHQGSGVLYGHAADDGGGATGHLGACDGGAEVAQGQIVGPPGSVKRRDERRGGIKRLPRPHRVVRRAAGPGGIGAAPET